MGFRSSKYFEFINIGGKDAKKFVLQSTGRGIRIQPIDGVRKRLTWDEGKEQLLETVYISSDRKTINAIKETVEDEGSSTELVVSLKKIKLNGIDTCTVLAIYFYILQICQQ